MAVDRHPEPDRELYASPKVAEQRVALTEVDEASEHNTSCVELNEFDEGPNIKYATEDGGLYQQPDWTDQTSRDVRRQRSSYGRVSR